MAQVGDEDGVLCVVAAECFCVFFELLQQGVVAFSGMRREGDDVGGPVGEWCRQGGDGAREIGFIE